MLSYDKTAEVATTLIERFEKSIDTYIGKVLCNSGYFEEGDYRVERDNLAYTEVCLIRVKVKVFRGKKLLDEKIFKISLSDIN